MKRRISFIVIGLLALLGSANAQTLSVQDIEMRTGEQAELVVSLTGATTMTALQFNLQLPAGVTANTGNVTLGSATDGHTLSVESLDSGDKLFILYSMDLNAFKNGELLRIPLTAGNTEVSSVGKLNTIFTATAEAVSNACVDASFSVKVKAPEPAVTITADNLTMVYGDNVPTLTYKTSGGELKGTPSLTTTATKTSPVGTYPIVVTKGSVTNENVTYVNGTLTITKAPLNIAAGTYTKKQGEAMPEFALSYTGFKNNETKAVLTKQPAVNCNATVASAPGEYPVVVSGAEAQNYEISYTNGKLIVVDADAIVVKANNYSRKYGEANPTFEYTVEGTALNGTPEITCAATATSPVGDYPIVVKKGSVQNYNVTYVNGTLTITKAPLKASVGNYSREQGQDNPKFTINYSGWKNNEKESVLVKKPVATTDATKNSPVGQYTITVSGGEARNYEFEYVNGILTVTAPSGIEALLASGQPFDVYTTTGVKVKSQVTTLKGLPQGVYIINKKKVFVK